MYKLLVIARRELVAMVGTKAFLISLCMMPLLMLGGLLIMPQLNKLSGVKTRKILVADATGQLLPIIKAAAESRNAMVVEATKQATEEVPQTEGKDTDSQEPAPTNEPKKSEPRRSGGGDPFAGSEVYEIESLDPANVNDEERLRLSEQMRSGTLYAFVEIPAGALPTSLDQPPVEITFVCPEAALSAARQWMQSIIQQEARKRRIDLLQLDPTKVAMIDQSLGLSPALPFQRDAEGHVVKKETQNPLITFFVPFGVMMLMFLVIFLAAQPMLESAMEEKGQRIAEVLLGCVNPSQLMAGKLLGNVAGSLIVIAIYASGALGVMYYNNWLQYFPWSVAPWFLVFQFLGVLFFSSIFLTIGAAVTEMKEAQSLLLPVWLLMSLPLMVWFVAVRDPNGPVAVALSFFPPATPLMMALRLTSGQAIPLWQTVLSVIVLLSTCLAIVFVAGRVYRASLLRTDSARTPWQLLQRAIG